MLCQLCEYSVRLERDMILNATVNMEVIFCSYYSTFDYGSTNCLKLVGKV